MRAENELEYSIIQVVWPQLMSVTDRQTNRRWHRPQLAVAEKQLRPQAHATTSDKLSVKGLSPFHVFHSVDK